MKNKKEVKPSTVCLLMSEGCNLACTYCFEKTKANKKISLDVLAASWNILKNNNKQKQATFMIFGGEPTLYFFLFKTELQLFPYYITFLYNIFLILFYLC